MIFEIKAETDFITKVEYSQMLYIEPRGVSCVKCHGYTGRKRAIIPYNKHYANKPDKTEEKNITITPIYNLGSSKFIKGVLNRRTMFMPSYNLSVDEIKQIFFFLQHINGLIKNPKLNKKLVAKK